MTVQTIPTSVPSDGTVALWWVPSSASWDPESPLASVLEGGTGVVKAECYLKENFNPGVTAESVEDRRMCSKQVFEGVGTRTYTIEEIVGVYDPQDPNGLTDSGKLYAALAPGATGHLVARWGIDLEGPAAAAAAGQFVDSYPVVIATRRKMRQEANSQLKFGASPRITGPVVEDKPLGPPPAWQASTTYALGQYVTLGAGTAECTTAGTSGAGSEPTLPGTVGGTVVDGTVTWTRRT